MKTTWKWLGSITALALVLAAPPFATADELKLAVVSWNVEDAAPSDKAIADLIKDGDLNDFDVICVAEQESADSGGYVAQRLTEKLKGKWYHGDPKGKGDTVRKDVKKSRQTLTGWSGKKITCGVIWNEKVNGYDLEFDRETVKGKRKKVFVFTGKGGAIVYMDFAERRMAFVSCHLNDESNKNRESELKDITDALTKADCDAVFLTGDLNFRAQGYDAKNLPVLDDVLGDLVDAKKRKAFYEKYDYFSNKGEKVYNLTFPPAHDFFPTYKRNTEGVELPKKPTKEDLLKYYQFPWVGKDGKKPKKKKDNDHQVPYEIKESRMKTQDFAIGWLDRLGYWTDGQIKMKGKPDFTALSNVGTSDHAPVIFTCKLEFDPNEPDD